MNVWEALMRDVDVSLGRLGMRLGSHACIEDVDLLVCGDDDEVWVAVGLGVGVDACDAVAEGEACARPAGVADSCVPEHQLAVRVVAVGYRVDVSPVDAGGTLVLGGHIHDVRVLAARTQDADVLFTRESRAASGLVYGQGGDGFGALVDVDAPVVAWLYVRRGRGADEAHVDTAVRAGNDAGDAMFADGRYGRHGGVEGGDVRMMVEKGDVVEFVRLLLDVPVPGAGKQQGGSA